MVGFSANFCAVSVAVASSFWSGTTRVTSPEFPCALRIERQSQLNQLRRAQVANTCGYRIAGSEFRHERQIDEWHLELRTLSRVHEVTVGQHCGPPANGGAMHRSNHRLFKIDQRADQLSLWTLAWSWRVPHEVLHIISRTERIAGTMPEHDTYVVDLRGGVERVRDGDVHR